MATNENIRKKFQAGIEVTPGTHVAATRKVYADISGSYDRPPQAFQDRSGTTFARRRFVQGRPVIGFSGTDLATYEDLAWWGLLAVDGAPTLTDDGGAAPGPAYTRLYTPDGLTDNLKSVTLEHGEPGNPYESGQFYINTMTLRVAPDADVAWMIDFEAMAIDWEPTTYTAAIADRTTEAIRAAGSKAYIDLVTPGTTQITGKIIDFSVTLNVNRHLKAFLENDTSWAANKSGRNEWAVDASVQLEFDNDDYFEDFRGDQVPFKLRVEREGTEINTDVSTLKSAYVDVYGYWSQVAFGDREGNMTATYSMMGYFDVGEGTDFEMSVTNALATLP
jgi:hypothetical protein